MALGILFLFIANFAGGAITPLFVKLGVAETPPITYTVLRFFISTLVILPFYLSQKKSKLEGKNLKLILLNSAFFTLNVGLFSEGVHYTSAVMSQLLYSFVPIIVAFLAHAILRERITRNKLIGSLVAFTGLLFLFEQSFVTQQEVLGKPLGNLIIIAGVLSWSFYFVFSKKATAVTSPVTLLFVNFLMSTVFWSFLIPFELKGSSFSIFNISQFGLISLLVTSIFSSVIVMNLLQVGIKKTSAFIGSLFNYITPLATALTAVPFLGEKITLNLILGSSLILFGVFYATTYSKLLKILVQSKKV